VDIGDVTVDFTTNAAAFVANIDLMIEAVQKFDRTVMGAVVAVETLHQAVDDLPAEHVTNVTLTGEDEILEQVAEIREYIDALPDDKTIWVRMAAAGEGGVASPEDTGAAADAINDLTDALDRNAESWARVENVGRDYSVMMGETIADANETSGALDRIFAVTSDGAVEMRTATQAADDFYAGLDRVGHLGDELQAQIRETGDAADLLGQSIQENLDAGMLAAFRATDTLDKGLADLGGAAEATAGAAQAAGTGWRAFGWMTANTLHWIIAGGAEILAVTIPALVALGAGAAVALQGAVDIGEHMESVYTATEATANMFHTTAGQVVGLGHALQDAQNAADPSVYGILGSAVITVNEHFGDLAQTGLQVVDMFQTFAARVAADFAPGGSMGGTVDELLSHMTEDLRGIGELFGNLGHALLTFASQMPGLAEVLLGSFAGIAGALSNVLSFVSKFQLFGASLLTVFMGFEEFNRWGGLVASTLTKMGLASASLTGGPFSFARMGSVIQGLLSVFPTLIGYVGSFATKIGAAGAGNAISTFAKDISEAIKGLTVFQAGLLGAALVGLGFMIDQMVTYQSATQKFTDSLQAAVIKAPNIQAFQQVAQNIAAINTQLVQVAATAPRVVSGLGRGAYVEINPAIAQLHAGLTQQEQDMRNVSQGAAYLATTYKTTLVGGMALASLANVQLAKGIMGSGQSAQIARLQIASLVQGYMSMGAPLTAVGSDVNALAIQSGLASTQVSNLNSAWDQFMQNLTGGTSDLAGLVTSLQNIGQVAGTTQNNLGTATGTMSLSTSQFANALKSMSGEGAGAWTNFGQVVGSTAPQLIDWMRTAGAEGALSGSQFKQGVLDMASALVPLAANSGTAQTDVLGLVHEADPSITTWNQLTAAIGKSGASLSGLTPLVDGATKKMGNMSQVAQNLGTATNTALLSTLSTAKVMASGVGTAMQQYEQALMDGDTHTGTLRDHVLEDFAKMGIGAQQAEQIINAALAGIPTSKTIGIHFMTVGTVPSGYGISGRPSQGGWRVPGYGGGDIHPALLEGGETVVPKELTPAVAPLMKAHGVPGFQGGGIMGGWYDGGFFPGIGPVLSGASGGSSGGGGGLPVLELHLHGDLADKNIWENGQIQTLRYNYRNSGRPTGAVKPS
jgi:hypothetical protein